MPAGGVGEAASPHAWCKLVRLFYRPAGRSILEVEPGVYSLSPEALCAAVAREVGCIQAFALAQELCSKISLSDRGQYLPPYSSPTVNRLAKDKDQPSDVGYFEVEPVLTPDRLADYLAACKGSAAKQAAAAVPLSVGKPALTHGMHHACHVFASVFLWRICLRSL